VRSGDGRDTRRPDRQSDRPCEARPVMPLPIAGRFFSKASSWAAQLSSRQLEAGAADDCTRIRIDRKGSRCGSRSRIPRRSSGLGLGRIRCARVAPDRSGPAATSLTPGSSRRTGESLRRSPLCGPGSSSSGRAPRPGPDSSSRRLAGECRGSPSRTGAPTARRTSRRRSGGGPGTTCWSTARRQTGRRDRGRPGPPRNTNTRADHCA
jgi:hypothetical protein